MHNLRVPVYIWNDRAGNVYGVPLDSHGNHFPVNEGACGSDPDSVLRQLKESLRITYAELSRQGEYPDTSKSPEYEIRTIKISVRASYERDDRDYPLGEKIELKLPVLIGKEENGMLRCSMPYMGLNFGCFKDDNLRTIVSEKFREEIIYGTPEEILLQNHIEGGAIRYVSFPIKTPGTYRKPDRYPYLEKLARPVLARLQRGGSSAYKREKEVHELISTLEQGARNIVLLGPEGVGKSTVLNAAVKQLERRKNESETDIFVKRRFWRSTGANLISGTKYLGEWQAQLENVIAELAGFDGVLCIDNLAELAKLGGEPEESLAAFLVPYLESGAVRIIGEASPGELEALRLRNSDFIELFRVVAIDPLSQKDASEALEELAVNIVREKGAVSSCTISPELPSQLVRLFKRFKPYQPLPGGAAVFLRNFLGKSLKSGKESIGTRELYDAFIGETGLPRRLLIDSKTLTFEEVESHFKSRIIGQDEPCAHAAEAVIAYKTAMNHPDRPIRSMLFCGPSGVGKTQLAKTMSEYLFGGLDAKKRDNVRKFGQKPRLFRLDMSEYMHPWSASRLIEMDDGSPSPLIRHARKEPFSVILFDEIEKAAPEVFDLLLGLLDEGRLSDRIGRTTFFRSTIIIMTSNLGGGHSSVGFSHTDDPDARKSNLDSQKFMKAVRDFFRPEFFNRIDVVAPFAPLDRISCRKIVELELARLEKREGLANRKLRFVPSAELIDELLKKGFDPRYGARPLQRTIESTVLPRIAEMLSEIDAGRFEDAFFVKRI